MQPPKSMRIERKDAKATQFYAVLFTVLPVLCGLGLIWVDGVIAKVGMLACAAFAYQSIRANLGFSKTIERVDDRVLVHPLWTNKVQTLQGLTEVVIQLAIPRGAKPARFVADHFTLRFPEGPVLVQTSAYPDAKELVASLLQEVSGDVAFPLELGESAMQHWTGSPEGPSLGVAASYRHVNGTLVTIYVYGAKDIAKGLVDEELASSLAAFKLLCQKKQVPHEVTEPSKTMMGGLEFLSASMAAGAGARAIKSQLLLTKWQRRLLKVRVADAPKGEITGAEATLKAFLAANS